MQDLRFIEQRDNSLVFVNESGEEFSFKLTEDNLRILREASRPPRSSSKTVNPREIQTMLRSGSSSEEAAETLGLELSDVQRYEGPIIAERKFILQSSHNVEVRTADNNSESIQFFGPVINERVKQLTDKLPNWSVWREDNSWMVKASFDTEEVKHNATWAFDHKKNQLTAVNADAISLSKQGDVGEKLIPTLRAVNFPDDKHTSALNKEQDFLFSKDNATDDQHSADEENPDDATVKPQTDSTYFEDVEELDETENVASATTKDTPEDFQEIDDFTRRQKIDERAISSDRHETQLHSETADLLEALRKRRSQRQNEESDDRTFLTDPPPSPANETLPITIPDSILKAVPQEKEDSSFQDDDSLKIDDFAETEPAPSKSKKGRTSVPSWEEILFGQKGGTEEDN
ncbi:MAG TPA: septation protein SepH [Microbacteriaceae bacterium]|nr:septation protein SepH [Microbacteriaceae bacterium]